MSEPWEDPWADTPGRWLTHPGWVYVLHLDKPLGDTTRKGAWARHYIGWARYGGLTARLSAHQAGTSGAAMMTYTHQAGIGFHLALLYTGDRGLERRLKNRHGGIVPLCPTCQATRQLEATLCTAATT